MIDESWHISTRVCLHLGVHHASAIHDTSLMTQTVVHAHHDASTNTVSGSTTCGFTGSECCSPFVAREPSEQRQETTGQRAWSLPWHQLPPLPPLLIQMLPETALRQQEPINNDKQHQHTHHFVLCSADERAKGLATDLASVAPAIFKAGDRVYADAMRFVRAAETAQSPSAAAQHRDAAVNMLCEVGLPRYTLLDILSGCCVAEQLLRDHICSRQAANLKGSFRSWL